MNERMNEQGMMNVEYLNESVTKTKWNVLMTMLAIPRKWLSVVCRVSTCLVVGSAHDCFFSVGFDAELANFPENEVQSQWISTPSQHRVQLLMY